MKKKLALLLSAVMIATMVPVSSFATSKNSVDRVVTSTSDKDLKTPFPILTMKEENLKTAKDVTFKLTLSNAEWLKDFGIDNLEFADVTTPTELVGGTEEVPGTPAVKTTRTYKNGFGGDVYDSYTKGSVTTDVTKAQLISANALTYTLVDATKAIENPSTVKTGNVLDDASQSVHLIGGKYYSTDDTDVFEVTASTTPLTYVEITTPEVPGTPAGGGSGNAKVTRLSDTSVIIQISYTQALQEIRIDLATKVKNEGEATVTVDQMNSVVSSGTYKFANVAGGSTITTIEKKSDLQEAGSKIKSVVITEAAAGSLKGSANGEFKLKLSNGFEFTNAKLSSKEFTSLTDTGITITSYPDLGTPTVKVDSDSQELYVKFSKLTSGFTTSEAATISFSGLFVGYDEDDVEVGDIAEITVSGYDMSKATVEVGTAVSYGVVVEAENKTLPTFVAGRYDADQESLKVTFKETVAESWLDGRKTTITFPEGVKANIDTLTLKDGIKSGLTVDSIKVSQKADKTEFTLPADITRTESKDKIKFELKFNISVDPSFTGDIKAVFGGAGLESDQEIVIGTAVAPITVEAETNEVVIDYRNVAVGDILIKETEAGYLKKDTVLYLGLEYLDFDGTPTVEVVEGDIKIDKVKVESVGDTDAIAIYIKTASNKTPAVLKVTDNQLFLGRSIPAGSYELSLVAGKVENNKEKKTEVKAGDDAIFRNYADPAKDTLAFDTDEVVVLEDFIEVVTAGRDTADLFTTTISVAIGADKLVAGKTEIALDVPAYISEGYTMLPVRAVIEALSGSAIVRWDDATKTVTLTFGSRVVNMTVGSKTMNINGVAVQMSKACEITDSRAFIPLRDLGYALGLNDSKINWDDATKTATLN